MKQESRFYSYTDRVRSKWLRSFAYKEADGKAGRLLCLGFP